MLVDTLIQSPPTYQWLALGSFALIWFVVRAEINRRKVDVPIIGSSGIISSYICAFKFFTKGQDLIREGYKKHRNGIFKISELGHWRVYVCSAKLVEESRHIPETTLTAAVAADEHLKADYTLGPTVVSNDYHAPIVQNQLTRNIGNILPEMVEEMRLAFEDKIPLPSSSTSKEVTIPLFETCLEIVARTASRALVGVPMCRNEEYLKFCATYAPEVFMSAMVIGLFPRFMMGFATNYLTSVGKSRRRALELMAPFIQERLDLIDTVGSEDKSVPNDLVTWLINSAIPSERTPVRLVDRLLTINVVSMHTTSINFANALKYLAAFTEYRDPIREEVRAVIEDDGWTKTSIGKMRKLDSFLREVLRHSAGGVTSMERLALKPFTFSDGTHIPIGTHISFVMPHWDQEVYGPTANQFNGFRFSDIRASTPSEVTKHQAVFASPEFLTFGYGRHTCPGRFFAINEIKAMLSHVLLTYDFRFDDPTLGHGELPTTATFGSVDIPDSKSRMIFKRRNV